MSEFSVLMKYINDLRSRYFKALSAFYAYEGMRENVAINLLGETEAQANADTMGRYKDFFVPAQEALRVYFFIELAKLFDASDEALHINKVVNFTESNIQRLNVDAFKEHNSGQTREFLELLATEYKGVAHSDLTEIRDSLNAHRESLEKLKTYRDEWLAHDDIHKSELPNITGEEIRALFEVLAKILNSLTGKLNSESTMWDHVERDVKHHTKLVVEYLRRFEPYRLQEIHAEAEERLKRYKAGEIA
jgi:hypothetical protein